MISKRISTKVKNDNYRRLAEYVRNAKADYAQLSKYIEDKTNVGEKVLYAWHQGCMADEYDLAIKEVQATQKMNWRSQKEKTYHLIISFRAEDEAKLTEDTFHAIEEDFAEALGFNEHQRHCGVHKNTAHIHLHIAYNMIRPHTFSRYEPYRDYWKRDSLCRLLEQKYGLTSDNGRKEKVKRENDKARIVEAQTGQQSFDSYLHGRRDYLINKLLGSQNWSDFHAALGSIGVVIALQGSGCIFKDKHGKHAVKGSALDRKFSLPQLVKLFGPFQECQQEVEEKERYTAMPLRGADRRDLFLEYQKAIDERKKFLDIKFSEHKAREKAIKDKWERKRMEIRHDMDFSFGTKKSLIAKTRAKEAEEMQALYEERIKAKNEIRESVPFVNWLEFLQFKAEQGSELALKILRSKNQDDTASAKAKQKEHGTRWRDTANTQNKIAEIYADSDLSYKTKTLLAAVVKMQEIQSGGFTGTEDITYKIDKSGIIIYTLSDGSRILDDGKKIHFTGSSEVARTVAGRYARSRFGPCRFDGGNALVRDQSSSSQRGH
jgi:hypothetical protein